MTYKKAINYCIRCYELAQNASVRDFILGESELNSTRFSALRSATRGLSGEEYDRIVNMCIRCFTHKPICKSPKIAEFFQQRH